MLPRETSLAAAPRLLLELVLLLYSFVVRTWLACSRRFSSFTGLGMKPTSQPSLTSRPIHQLLSYFSWTETKEEEQSRVEFRRRTYFDVQELLNVEGYRATVDWRVVVLGTIVGDVGSDRKRYRFSLKRQNPIRKPVQAWNFSRELTRAFSS